LTKKKKYYVVWDGHQTGVFDQWKDCEKAIKEYHAAKYKSFDSIEQAQKALTEPFYKHIGQASKPKNKVSNTVNHKPVLDSISVDAAWNTVTKDMEYQGVYTKNKKQLFKVGPLPHGTNNVGEFLAIVHALALCKQKNNILPIYTDSMTAMAWVRNKKAKTTLAEIPANEKLFEYIDRAEQWLKNNIWPNKILKWDTENWGEIPADFGRK
jgi:ribonuclease HI